MGADSTGKWCVCLRQVSQARMIDRDLTWCLNNFYGCCQVRNAVMESISEAALRVVSRLAFDQSCSFLLYKSNIKELITKIVEPDASYDMQMTDRTDAIDGDEMDTTGVEANANRTAAVINDGMATRPPEPTAPEVPDGVRAVCRAFLMQYNAHWSLLHSEYTAFKRAINSLLAGEADAVRRLRPFVYTGRARCHDFRKEARSLGIIPLLVERIVTFAGLDGEGQYIYCLYDVCYQSPDNKRVAVQCGALHSLSGILKVALRELKARRSVSQTAGEQKGAEINTDLAQVHQEKLTIKLGINGKRVEIDSSAFQISKAQLHAALFTLGHIVTLQNFMLRQMQWYKEALAASETRPVLEELEDQLVQTASEQDSLSKVRICKGLLSPAFQAQERRAGQENENPVNEGQVMRAMVHVRHDHNAPQPVLAQQQPGAQRGIPGEVQNNETNDDARQPT